jgi:intracellular septation protein A
VFGKLKEFIVKLGNSILRGVVCGGISGLLVLGIALRLGTIGIAYLYGSNVNLSVRNLIEFLVAACLIGVFGGITIVIADLFIRLRRAVLITVNSAFLAALSVVPALIGKPGLMLHTEKGLILMSLVVSMLVLYNVVTLALIERFDQIKRRQS